MAVVLAFLASKLGRYVVLGLVTTALIGGLYFTIYNRGRVAGHAADTKATLEQQIRIDDARDRGPRSPVDVDRRLRDGKF